MDVYFSADVETDGPIPGPFSMLSFALVYAGTFDGKKFVRPTAYEHVFYKELRPISEGFQEEALRVNGLNRQRLAYVAEKDGRLTEPVLQQWFAPVDPATELGRELIDELVKFLWPYGKDPSTRTRINVPITGANVVKTKNDDLYQTLTDTLIAAAKTLPPTHLAKLRSELFNK